MPEQAWDWLLCAGWWNRSEDRSPSKANSGSGTTFRFTLPIATVTATHHPVEMG